MQRNEGDRKEAEGNEWYRLEDDMGGTVVLEVLTTERIVFLVMYNTIKPPNQKTVALSGEENPGIVEKFRKIIHLAEGRTDDTGPMLALSQERPQPGEWRIRGMKIRVGGKSGEPQFVIQGIQNGAGGPSALDIIITGNGDAALTMRDPELERTSPLKHQKLEMQFNPSQGGTHYPGVAKEFRAIARLIAENAIRRSSS